MTGSPDPSVSAGRSHSLGCGASPGGAPLPDRSAPTMCRSSVSVLTASSRTVRASSRDVPSWHVIWSAPACTLIRLTWCATTSCISRASRARSVITARSASSSASRCRLTVSSRTRSRSSRRVRAHRPDTAGTTAWTQESTMSSRSSRSAVGVNPSSG
ncbi:hypothetical protein STAL104432_32470 [Streptomyces albus]